MKLIYIANARIPSEKAHPYQVMQMCEAFAKQGIALELVCPQREKTNRMHKVNNIWDYYGVEETFKLTKLPAIDLHMKFLRMSNSKKLQKIAFWSLEISFAVVSVLYVLFKKADIYYSRDVYATLLLTYLKPWCRNKVIFEEHTFSNSTYGRKLRHICYKRVGKIIIITQALKQLLADDGIDEEKLLVAPDSVHSRKIENQIPSEVARTKLKIPLDSKIVCYTGQLYPWKGVYTLVDAMSHLPKNITLYIVGGNNFEDDFVNLSSYARRLNLEQIIFTGHVDPDIARTYQFAADILVIPNSAQENISKYYTSPLKLFEYMAAKKPIVASNLPSLTEILSHHENSILCEADNPPSLARSIREALENKDLADTISTNAFRDVKNYTWENRTKEIIKFSLS